MNKMDFIEVTFMQDTDDSILKINNNPKNNESVHDENTTGFNTGNTSDNYYKYNTNIENINSVDLRQNENFNKDFTIDEYQTITEKAVTNISSNNANDLNLDITEFFIREHPINCDNCYACAMTSSKLKDIQMFINNNKYENIVENSYSEKTYENSGDILLGRTIFDTNENRRTPSIFSYNVLEGAFNLDDVGNTNESGMDIVKPKMNPIGNLNIEFEFKSNDNFIKLTNYKIDEDFVQENLIPKADLTIEENNIISISSESSVISIDSIELDPSCEHNMKIDFIDDSEGYNSSDFEFIDAKEASLGGIVNKSGLPMEDSHTIAIEEHRLNFYEPGPSRIGDDKFNRKDLDSLNSSSNSEPEFANHIIPEGEQYFQLFNEPWASFNFQAENKAFFSNRAMHVEADEIGFNVAMLNQRHLQNDVDDNVKREAVDNARKIIMMYPAQNKKRRQRKL